MSSCSMSYRIKNTDPVESVELNFFCTTIPTVLLLRKLDCSVERIGNVAKDTRYALSDRSCREYHYFELDFLLYRYKVSTAME